MAIPDYLLAFPASLGCQAAALWRGEWNTNQPQTVDWEVLSQNAEAGGAFPVLYDTIQHNGYAPFIPKTILDRMEVVYRRTQVANTARREKLRQALSILSTAGIPVIVLKGAALSELVYGDIGLRPMSDLDLLVRPEHAEQAVATLRAAGYQRVDKPELRPGIDHLFRVEIELLSPEPFASVLEIHWLPVGPLFASRYVDHAAIWDRAVPVNIVGQPAYRLGAEDWVLHQTAHGFYKHRSISLLTLFDMDRLIRYLGVDLDWDVLLKIGEAFHWLPALAAVLPSLVSCCNSLVPEHVIQAAANYNLPVFESKMLQWWLTPGRPERQHIIPDWLVLPTLQERFKVLWAYIFPSRDYLEATYARKASWQIPFMYLHYWWFETKTS